MTKPILDLATQRRRDHRNPNTGEPELVLAVLCQLSEDYDECQYARIRLGAPRCRQILAQHDSFVKMAGTDAFKLGGCSPYRLSLWDYTAQPFDLPPDKPSGDPADEFAAAIQGGVDAVSEIMSYPRLDDDRIIERRADGELLNISQENIWWTFYPKHVSEQISTPQIPIDLLRDFIAAVKSGMTMQDFDVLAAIAQDREAVRNSLEDTCGDHSQ